MSSEGWDVIEGAVATEQVRVSCRNPFVKKPMNLNPCLLTVKLRVIELIIEENSTCHGRPQRVIELIIGENSTCHRVIELIKCRPIWRPGLPVFFKMWIRPTWQPGPAGIF